MASREQLYIPLKGLPKIAAISLWPQNSSGDATVSISLERETRAAVAAWAKHLEVDVVVETEPSQTRPGSGAWTSRIAAVKEIDGVQIRVWTTVPVDAPAVQPAAAPASDVAPEAGR